MLWTHESIRKKRLDYHWIMGMDEMAFNYHLKPPNQTTFSVVLLNHHPIGSMVLVYMLTWLGYINGIHVTIYGSTMDPSWAFFTRSLPGETTWNGAIFGTQISATRNNRPVNCGSLAVMFLGAQPVMSGRIHGAAIYGVPWIPSIYTPFILAYISAPWIRHGLCEWNHKRLII